MRAVIAVVLIVAASGCVSNVGGSHAENAKSLKAAGAAKAGAALVGWVLDSALSQYSTDPDWLQLNEVRASHSPGPKEETWAAVNPKDPNNVVIGAKDLNPASSAPDSTDHCVWNGVFVTHDGGKTWSDHTIGGNYNDRGPDSPYYGYSCNTDPDFQFTADGALHYGIEMYGLCAPGSPRDAICQGSLGWKILLATSYDGGDTWPLVVTYHPDLIKTADYSRMTVNPKSQVIVEQIGSAPTCDIMVSTDGGKTANFYPQVSPVGSTCSSNNGAVAGSPDGVLVSVGNGNVARSMDDGRTWPEGNALFAWKHIAGKFKESNYRSGGGLELAFDLSKGPNRGTLYAAYQSADRDEADVFVRASKDLGKTWGPAVLVNDDEPGTHQWMPNVAVAGDGSVHVVFMDKRYDPNHKFIDITHAVSLDGGLTWTNTRVSTVPYDGDLGVHQDGGSFIGDYIGISAVGNDVWMGFPDASNGVTTVIAAAKVSLVQ